MKAKKVFENINNILKPKSNEEIVKGLKLDKRIIDLILELKIEIVEAFSYYNEYSKKYIERYIMKDPKDPGTVIVMEDHDDPDPIINYLEKKAKKVHESLDESIAISLACAYRNHWAEGGDLVKVYKNQPTLRRFENGVRAISDVNGNLYVADKGTMHSDLEHALRNFVPSYDKARKEHPGKVGDWQRAGDSNTFYLGESWGFDGYFDSDEQDWQMLTEIKETVERKNPQFEYIIDRTIIGTTYKELDKEKVNESFKEYLTPKDPKFVKKEFDKLNPQDQFNKAVELNWFSIFKELYFDRKNVDPLWAGGRNIDVALHNGYNEIVNFYLDHPEGFAGNKYFIKDIFKFILHGAQSLGRYEIVLKAREKLKELENGIE